MLNLAACAVHDGDTHNVGECICMTCPPALRRCHVRGTCALPAHFGHENVLNGGKLRQHGSPAGVACARLRPGAAAPHTAPLLLRCCFIYPRFNGHCIWALKWCCLRVTRAKRGINTPHQNAISTGLQRPAFIVQIWCERPGPAHSEPGCGCRSRYLPRV